jgi:hypothetical protein
MIFNSLTNQNNMNFIKRLKEFIKISFIRLIEFSFYTISGIDFYRNYSRFYWKNKKNKQDNENKRRNRNIYNTQSYRNF